MIDKFVEKWENITSKNKKGGFFVNSINSNVDLNGLSKQDALTTGEIAGGILGVFYTIMAIIYILEIIGMWKMFVKAGIAGWKSLIPIYNLVLLFKISGEF